MMLQIKYVAWNTQENGSKESPSTFFKEDFTTNISGDSRVRSTIHHTEPKSTFKHDLLMMIIKIIPTS